MRHEINPTWVLRRTGRYENTQKDGNVFVKETGVSGGDGIRSPS